MNLDDRLDALFIAIALGTLAVLVILAATAYVAVCRALDTRTDRRARQAAAAMDDAVTVALDARTERRARQAATAIDDAVAIALDEACCETWWTSAGTDHEPACPTQTRKPR